MLGVYLFAAGFIIDNGDNIIAFIERKNPQGEYKFYFSLVLYIAAVVRTTTGRYLATTDVYTPRGLPGRSKQDAIDNSRNN
jgi:hypothetical protein